MDEDRDQKSSTIPESLKNHLGPGSVDIMNPVKQQQQDGDMKLILGPNSQQQDEQWAKEQEDQIENAEMYNVEKALPQVPNSLPHNSENFEESKTKGTTEKNKKKDKNCMLF